MALPWLWHCFPMVLPVFYQGCCHVLGISSPGRHLRWARWDPRLMLGRPQMTTSRTCLWLFMVEPWGGKRRPHDPVWKIWKSVGIIIPNIYIYIWKNKIHVTNHQPVYLWHNFLSVGRINISLCSSWIPMWRPHLGWQNYRSFAGCRRVAYACSLQQISKRIIAAIADLRPNIWEKYIEIYPTMSRLPSFLSIQIHSKWGYNRILSPPKMWPRTFGASFKKKKVGSCWIPKSSNNKKNLKTGIKWYPLSN